MVTKWDKFEYIMSSAVGVYIIIISLFEFISANSYYESYEFTKDWDLPEDIRLEPLHNAYMHVILGIIGIKMILDARKSNSEQNIEKLSIKILVAQSIATSIDAFVIGISFAVLKIGIIKPIIIIGITTFLFSMIGLRIGKFLGYKVGSMASTLGGSVLIGIGTKILIEHIYF